MRFEDEGYYLMEPFQMRRLWQVAQRLYSQDRLSGDDMRDLAQIIQAMLERAVHVTEREIPQ